MPRLLVLFLVGCFSALCLGGDSDLPSGIKDTQSPKDKPPSPEEAVKRFKAPDGFKVTLFAGEPDVRQPIALTFDDRGRVWVAECYSYPEWKADGQDRILIFEDTDGDGKFDNRTVFLDKLPNLTGLAVGHGGVWALSAPNLLFIPDKDRDDRPDDKPRVILDGWTLKAGHNVVNGMTWGPDGWLYGRHGITNESRVGKPGTPDAERTKLNCSIWRYHPTRHVFDVVCHGTTNPWGLDFDDHGEAFFTNCVIGHLWHMVPGAHYVRMYGRDYNPHAYELIDATSDHLHWGGGHWSSSRTGAGVHSEAGGGHAHSGAMVYLGDNWPEKYRNGLFTCNIHGNRVNHDIPERKGCGYVGKHAPDVLTSTNPWFRGIAIDYGADGAVYVTDWSDLGECHDNDGVHRSSGRIYRVSFGEARAPRGLDLAKKTDADLVALQLHKNDWYVRRARRLLAERSTAGKPMGEVHKSLLDIYEKNPDVTRRLRALWSLYCTGGAEAGWLLKQLDDPDEHVRAWTVRLLGDRGQVPGDALRRFIALAEKERSGLVRLYLASALQRTPPEQRLALAGKLADRTEDAADHDQPLMIWYGIEPAVPEHKAEALSLAEACKMPKLRQFIARRLAEADAPALAAVVEHLEKASAENLRDLVQGLREGLKGRKSVKMPDAWPATYKRLSASSSAEVRESARFLAVQFDDPAALASLRQMLKDPDVNQKDRASVLKALVEKGVPDLLPDVLRLVDDRAMRGAALRALAAYDEADVAKKVLAVYGSLNGQEKQDALATLAARPRNALALLDAVESKAVPRTDLTAFTVRQIQDLRNKDVSARLDKVWGQVRQTPAEKKALIDRFKKQLTAAALAKADASAGRAVFNRICAQCHTLYGEGGKVGPDITGSDRANLHYVLENIIDPSALIGGDYRLVNVYTKEGRLIAGIVVEDTDRVLTLQSDKERVTLPKGDIEERVTAPVSMMPEGIAEAMKGDELRDLVAYLATKQQVPLRK